MPAPVPKPCRTAEQIQAGKTNPYKTYAPKKQTKTTLQRKPGSALKRSKTLTDERRGLVVKTKLKALGIRGRRLRPKDRKQAALAHQLPCCCGCNLPVEWAHLESRRFEETRHRPHLSIPACHYLHHWLDQGKGTAVRPLLLEMAKAKGERLTHGDVYDTIKDHGYYSWIHERAVRER